MQTIFKDNLFKDKVALVSGGGTGIGLRIARELAKLGATVVIASRKMENLEKGLDIISKEGGKAIPIQCNIREEESVKNCISETLKQAGGLDYLVNNGGGQFPSPAEFINRKGWHAVIETNLTGTFFMCQEAFNQHFNTNGGNIVNIIANISRGFPMLSHTGAARAGVDNLTKSLASEWGKYGVRINSIAPGTIDSSGLDNYDPQYKEFILTFAKNNQTTRLGTTAEISSSVLFLLSPGASFITGQTINVDGGESIYHPVMPPSANEKHPPFDPGG